MNAEMTLRPGELVDITIRAATVTDTGIDIIAVAYPDGDDVHAVELAIADAVEIVRVAPGEWPPKVGDLWRDADGVLWFATDKFGPLSIWLTNPSGRTNTGSGLLADRGPLTLVHREPRDAATVAELIETGDHQ